MSKISIVGAGITGLAVAVSTNKTVNIFEASRNIGGILRDLHSEGYSFFSGCQYFNRGALWFDRTGSDQSLYEFDHTYASYTDLFGKKTISNSFAGPAYDGLDLNYSIFADFRGISVADRLNLYPPEISTALKKWFRYIGIDIDITHHSAITAFQSSRIYVLGQEKKMIELKKNNKLADAIYGLPRNIIGLTSIKSFLPKRGFSDLFDNYHNQNINIKVNTTVNCDILNNRLVLKTKRGSFEPGLVIWTADPTKLVFKAFGKKLDSQKFVAEVLAGILDSPVDSPFYIQVYSIESRVMRIYLYNIQGQGCFTIEKAFDGQTTPNVVNESQAIIDKFLNKKIKNVLIRKKNPRYYAYTIYDYNTLSDLHSQNHIANLITPNYLTYGRDQKIDSIMSRLYKY